MKILLITLSLLISLQAISQQLKSKKKTKSYYKEYYSIDKKTKAKYGAYVKIQKESKDTLVVGFFENDKRVKIWKFYGADKKVYLAYDYDRSAITQIKKELLEFDSCFIKINNEFVLSKIESPPIYVGFENEIKKIIKDKIKIPSSILRKEKSGISVVSFVIDKKGQMQDIKIERILNKSLKSTITKSINGIKSNWVPAKYHGKPIASKIFVLFDIYFTSDCSTLETISYTESPYLYIIDMTLFGIKRKRVHRN